MYDKTFVIGNIGNDPEIRYMTNGDAVCNFSVAVNYRWKNPKSGEREERVKWFRVTCWRELAETCSKFCYKGMKVFCEGEVTASAFTDKQGKPQAGLELRALGVKFLSSKAEADAAAEAADVDEEEGVLP